MPNIIEVDRNFAAVKQAVGWVNPELALVPDNASSTRISTAQNGFTFALSGLSEPIDAIDGKHYKVAGVRFCLNSDFETEGALTLTDLTIVLAGVSRFEAQASVDPQHSFAPQVMPQYQYGDSFIGGSDKMFLCPSDASLWSANNSYVVFGWTRDEGGGEAMYYLDYAGLHFWLEELPATSGPSSIPCTHLRRHGLGRRCR
jgi:hypothetical protein